MSPAAKFLAALLGFVLYSVVYTFISMPYLALLPELAPGYDERTGLNAYRLAFALLANLVAIAAPPLVVARVTGATELAASAPAGWLVMAASFGVLMTLTLLITGFGVREPPPKGAVTVTQTGAPLSTEVASAFRSHGLWQVFTLFVVVTLGFMIANSVLPFFLESVLALSADEQPVILGTLIGVAILTFPFWSLLSGRVGKRAALTLGLLAEVVSLLLLVTVVPPGSISDVMVGVIVLNAFGLSAVTLFPWAMLPDVLEFDELAT